jgi:hypothetical protein
MSTMAEVIAAHQPANMSRERYCTCGAFIGDWATTEELAEHVAAELEKAGYGKLEDLTPVGFLDSIRADAWDEGADAEFRRSVMKRQRTPNPYRGAGHE